MSAERFVQLQRDHFYERADASHFRWQTEAPWFSATEAELVRGVGHPGERVLEIGCGEGGNLHHLRARSPGLRLFGVDFSPAKVAFARNATGAHTAAADATRLPFADCSFDAVLIRDLLHHLPNRLHAMKEARRVLKPGGRLTLVEPNRRSLLVLLQAALVPAERGVLGSTAEQLRAELAAAGFDVLESDERQPFPIARVLLNPRFGTTVFGGIPPVGRILDSIDRVARRLVPRSAWLYLTFQATRT